MNKEELKGLLENSKNEINNAVRFISKFQKGKLKPLKTSMSHYNDAALGGIIPGFVTSIGARPSHGKTYTLHQLKDDILTNGGDTTKMLLFNWEMPWFSLILIQIKKFLKKSFKEILLKEPSEEDLGVYKEILEKFRDDRMTTISKALTPEDWGTVVRMYIEMNIDMDLLIIGTDHLGIVVGDDKTKTIYKFMEIQNAIKLDYPDKVHFINLFQLKREIENLWKLAKTDPYKLRVTSELMFGADAMMQYSDIIFAQVIPDRANLDNYASVNKERNMHLEEHFEDDPNPTSTYVKLKASNRVYFDYIKRRMPEEGEPTLYCEILNKEKEEFIKATSEKEKDYLQDDEDDLDF